MCDAAKVDDGRGNGLLDLFDAGDRLLRQPESAERRGRRTDARDGAGYFADDHAALDADGILLDVAKGQRVYNGRIAS